MPVSDKVAAGGCIACVLIVIAAFALGELGIFVGGKYRPIPASEACPSLTIPPGGTFQLQKAV